MTVSERRYIHLNLVRAGMINRFNIWQTIRKIEYKPVMGKIFDLK